MSGPAPESSVARVEAALAERGLTCEIRRFPAGTRTSAEAAAAVGCAVSQIAKSLIFRAERSDRPVMVIASGANRVDEAAVASLIGEPIGRADAAFVRARTGFAIGGVAPVGHREAPIILIDRDLLEYETIWAAAGRPDSVFAIRPDDLVAVTGGRVAELKAEPG